jgi:hypothetical protein
MKMAIYWKQSTDSMQSCKNSNVILHRNSKICPKTHFESQKTLNSQSNPEKNKPTQLKPSDFWKSLQKPILEKKTICSINGYGKIEHPHVEDWC